jgi:hypothetical protein
MDQEKKQGTREENEQEKWVYDGSVDCKGKVPLRAKTGVWIASLFVLSKISTCVHFFFLMKFATIVKTYYFNKTMVYISF